MDGLSTLLIALYILLGQHGGESMTGYAPHYNPGVMDRVLVNRGLGPAPCNISSAYYDVGTWVWVVGWNTYEVRRCRVSDESDPTPKPNGGESDKARHRRTKRIMEASYEDALWMCGAKAMQGPSRWCGVTVIRIEGMDGEE